MNLDEQIFLAVYQGLDVPWVTALFSVVTWLGNGLVLAALALVPMFVFDRERFKRHAIPMVLAVALGGGVVAVVKPVVGRERPPDHFAAQGVQIEAPRKVPSDRSFPSGHAQTAFGTAVYLSCLYPPASPAFLLLAAAVGLSRVALGVHFPLDVVVGAALGSLLSIGAFLLARRRSRADPGTVD